ncbi:hypothetical protein [Rhodopseudomonas sp. P2A-2r]|uniref:hypothetical protein n=1 Tax=unclassified Rhodopseudomonas TaxID=2638247 RepID=UPI002233EF70|nr:hypothetical protein [Rhodopseudomonas sp. P2A-2r]UZE47313.1 hypothetical protein ONR75_20430 [Rhodopseudomonas sp. P2A-2r]
MLRAFMVVLALVVFAAAGSAEARPRHPVDATPFAHAPCSVLDNAPCTPSFCSVFEHGPCIPEIDYPIGQNLQVTVLSVPGRDDTGKYQRPDHDLDTLGDLFAMLRSCWSPPAQDGAKAGIQMSVMFSFNKSGAMIAAPRMTFASKDATRDLRQTYLQAIDASLDGCLPLRFTGGLAGAIAGRPIMIRYVDNRDLQNTAR